MFTMIQIVLKETVYIEGTQSIALNVFTVFLLYLGEFVSISWIIVYTHVEIVHYSFLSANKKKSNGIFIFKRALQ